MRPPLRGRCAVLLPLSLAVALFACKKEEAPPPPPRPPTAVETVTIAAAPFTRTVEAIGSLKSPQSTEVAAEIGGRVIALDIPEGTTVPRGHTLARLEASATSADLAVAQARLTGAKDTLARREELHQEKLVSEQEVLDANTAKQAARGEVLRSTALLDKTTLRAPFRGVVGLRLVSLGAYLSPGTPVTRITAVDALDLVFSVPERYVGTIAVGQAVRGMVGCERRFSGEVSVLDPVVEAITRSHRVLARIPNEDGRLSPGMSARIRVDVQTVPDAILIPEEALLRSGTREQVYVVSAEGIVEVKDIVSGEHQAATIEVLEGLAPGDVVIAAGLQKVRPGAKVAPAPHEPIENPNLALGERDGGADCRF